MTIKRALQKQKPKRFKGTNTIIVIIIITFAVLMVCLKAIDLKTSLVMGDLANQELSRQDVQITELTKENQQLIAENAALKASSPKAVLPMATFQMFSDMLFPTKDSAARYRQIVTTCENGTRNPVRVNVNTDGSQDIGVSQINDKYHSARVEKMFGESFLSAMTDSVKNMVYAAYLYRQSGNFHLWSCDSKV